MKAVNARRRRVSYGQEKKRLFGLGC